MKKSNLTKLAEDLLVELTETLKWYRARTDKQDEFLAKQAAALEASNKQLDDLLRGKIGNGSVSHDENQPVNQLKAIFADGKQD